MGCCCCKGSKGVVPDDAPAPPPQWDPNRPFFYFMSRSTVLESTMPLPRMQELRDSGRLVKKQIDLAAYFGGGPDCKQILFVSQRSDRSGVPDVNGERLRAIQSHLKANPSLQWVWCDYNCMPQKNGDAIENDGRTRIERSEFYWMLSAITNLYLTTPAGGRAALNL